MAQYNFIVPDLCHDMHQPCNGISQIRLGDTWLSVNVPIILRSKAYQSGALFITWDEGGNRSDEGEETSDGPLPMFVLSGIFFSAERFPAAVQPFVKALPLTALNRDLIAASDDYGFERSFHHLPVRVGPPAAWRGGEGVGYPSTLSPQPAFSMRRRFGPRGSPKKSGVGAKVLAGAGPRL